MTTFSAKKQLFLNYKGGTGKTSISSAYGYCLANMGKRVLMIDLDAQAHLTACLNQENLPHPEKSLYTVMLSDGKISDIIIPTALPELKLIPSSLSLSALEVPLFKMHLREFRLRQVLKEVERDFDFIIIDSAPNINLLSLNAIIASDEILIPLLADFLSFHGLKILMETLASIETDFNFYLGKIHIFLNRFNPQYPICGECKEAVHKFYPEYALKTVINESHEIIDASSMGKSVFELYPDSKVASDIRSLVEEVNKVPENVPVPA
ncbi:MAG: AAA family ATPase [Candidatus Omnitrophica bacterium]|nr:AAA family ATPase [Candidatus Omnitrophota bacterium]